MAIRQLLRAHKNNCFDSLDLRDEPETLLKLFFNFFILLMVCVGWGGVGWGEWLWVCSIWGLVFAFRSLPAGTEGDKNEDLYGISYSFFIAAHT